MAYINKENRNKNRLKHYKIKKCLIFNYLGNKCNICGNNKKLQIDHINPKTKKFDILQNWSLSFENLILELLKCQLLCKYHHDLKTKNEFNDKKFGENNKSSKLTIEDIIDIKELLSFKLLTSKNIAELFNVSKTTILNINNNIYWSNVINYTKYTPFKEENECTPYNMQSIDK